MESTCDCSTSSTTSIYIRDVPFFLQGGSFFLSLQSDDISEVIDVPSDAIKLNCEVRTEDDLIHLLRTLRFWMVESPTDSICEYLLFEDSSMLRIAEFEMDLP